MGKLTGRLGLAIGTGVGYVLGAKAGRERYEQIVEAARRLTEQPQVKRIVDQAPATVGSTVGQVAEKAADKVRQAGEKVAGRTDDGAHAATGPVVDTRSAPAPGRHVAEDPVPAPAPPMGAPTTTNPAPGRTARP